MHPLATMLLHFIELCPVLTRDPSLCYRIPYYLTLTKQYPGKILLSYMPRIKSRHEYITITPDGLRYRQQNFHSLNSLMRWFKEHFRDPIPGQWTARSYFGGINYVLNAPFKITT